MAAGSFLKQLILVFSFSIVAFIIPSCSDAFQDMDRFYQEGRYLKAAESAVEGLKNPSLQPKIVEFLKADGEKLIEKLFLQGEVLMKHKLQNYSIKYFEALSKILEELDLMNAPLNHLKQHLKQSEAYLTASINNYVLSHYRLGSSELKNKNFRSAVRHLESVIHYHKNYKDSQAKLTQAIAGATRSMTIVPIYKPADAMSQWVSDSLTKLLTFGAAATGGVLRIPLTAGGIDIPSEFMAATARFIDQRKSRFFSVNIGDDDGIQSDYVVKGYIDADIQDKLNAPDYEERVGLVEFINEDTQGQWETAHFNYGLYTLSYLITIRVQGSIFLKATGENLGTYSIEKSSALRSSYRDKASNLPKKATAMRYPNDYINMPERPVDLRSSTAVFEAVHLAAEEFTTTILTAVDKEKDPATKLY